MKISLAILGKNGHMGQAVQKVALQDKDVTIVDSFQEANLVIDFSSPEYLLSKIPELCAAKVPLVSGTTGLSETDMQTLRKASQTIPIFYSENFSLGITFLQKVVCEAAYLPSLISSKIHEVHHTKKKDQPSGTAHRFRKKLNEHGVQPEVTSKREGDEVGTHTITFELLGEKIELTHQALSKETFAKGALEAGKFLLEQPLGFYCMDDYYCCLEA